MTPGNNGASTPEDDDPFGYLYADGQANGAQPPAGGYGYPGSVNRVRTVGERQYGQVPQQQIYGQPAYGQSSTHYAAPETVAGAPATRQPPAAPGAGAGGGRGRGPNSKGLLIGAIAVVAAVVTGIGVAMFGGNPNDPKSGSQAGAGQSSSPNASASQSDAQQSSDATKLPKSDAKALRLEGGATIASDVKGAQADGGVYVSGFNSVGASVTWTVNGIQNAGSYRLYVRYSIPGVDANATLVVNGKPNQQPLGMKNFIHSQQGDFEKGWQSTWAPVTLNKGTNTVAITCGQGNQCNALIDQLRVQ